MRLHVLDPLECLTLWVDHQRPASASRDNDAVLRREPVARQTLNVPITDARRIDEEIDQFELRADWNCQLPDFGDPHLVDDLLPIARQERAHVRQEGRRDQYVSHQKAEPPLKILKTITKTPTMKLTSTCTKTIANTHTVQDMQKKYLVKLHNLVV